MFYLKNIFMTFSWIDFIEIDNITSQCSFIAFGPG